VKIQFPYWVIIGFPLTIKKEPTDFSGLLRVSSGAEGGTRTPTGFPTTPSSRYNYLNKLNILSYCALTTAPK
jgi:hypothetical protein